MPDAEEALDVVHHGHAEHGRVHVGVTPDRHVGQGLDGAVLAVELSVVQCVFGLFSRCYPNFPQLLSLLFLFHKLQSIP